MSDAELPENTEPTEVPETPETPETPKTVVVAEPPPLRTERDLLFHLVEIQKQQSESLTLALEALEKIRKNVSWIAVIIVGGFLLGLLVAVVSACEWLY